MCIMCVNPYGCKHNNMIQYIMSSYMVYIFISAVVRHGNNDGALADVLFEFNFDPHIRIHAL